MCFVKIWTCTFMYSKCQQLCPESRHLLLCDVGVKISSMGWRWNVPLESLKTFSTSSDRFVLCCFKKVVCLIVFRFLLDNLIWFHGERSVWYNKNEWSLLDVLKNIEQLLFVVSFEKGSAVFGDRRYCLSFHKTSYNAQKRTKTDRPWKERLATRNVVLVYNSPTPCLIQRREEDVAEAKAEEEERHRKITGLWSAWCSSKVIKIQVGEFCCFVLNSGLFS